MKKLGQTLILTISVSALLGCNSDSPDQVMIPTTPTEDVGQPEKPTQPEKPVPTISLSTYTPGTTEGGSSDASTAVALDDNFIIVADDEANILRVYPKNGGAAVASWNFEENGPMFKKELDIEASALLADNIVVFTGSHGNKKDGDDAMAERSHMFSVKITGTGKDTKFEYLGKYSDLESNLTEWDRSNQHGLGKDHFGLVQSAADGSVPERTHGFAIEGMTATHDESALLLGFRAPQLDTGTRAKALIIPVTNYAQLLKGTATSATFGKAIELNLGGRGVRSISKHLNNEYLIVAGPALANRNEIKEAFALYLWDGNPDSPARELNHSLEQMRIDSKGSIETIVERYIPSADVQLLLDNGDSIWPDQTAISKGLEDKDQRFQGGFVTISDTKNDVIAPSLVKISPEKNVMGVNTDTTIQLWFDEGVQLSTGDFKIYKGDTLVETIAANSPQVTLDFNRITITPKQKLDYETNYRVEMGAMIQDHQANKVPAGEMTQFKTAGQPTPLKAGDLYFMGGNAEAPDAIAFILMKDVDGGTEIYFSDRDYSIKEEKFWKRDKNGGGEPATNEGVFRWTADRFIKAGSIITIQTDTEASPIANIGQVLGTPSGIGKEETMFAMIGTEVADLQDGSAGLITKNGQFLASITLGGVTDNDIPAEIVNYSMKFLPEGKADQTNAIFDTAKCGFDRTNLATFASNIKDQSCWKLSFKSAGAAGWPLIEENSLFKNAVIR
ncbi:MAG: Ig-like domain-containing protein [Candidatus Acinetobacter avistercoris]|uniref:Ig-like domain-containing protein n=1 Tax=Acinetobacter sp. KS-LM10 TaxID=3120518 RepID=UPI001F9C7531|nr:Ig-like domain-containing protein [Candidatus Acinetobacter avistercoris]